MPNKIILVPLLTDMLAVPYLEAAAMENWGLITFKRALLSHSNKSGESTKLTSASVIAHKIAHQVLHTVNCTKIKPKELEWVLLVCIPVLHIVSNFRLKRYSVPTTVWKSNGKGLFFKIGPAKIRVIKRVCF